MPVNQEPQNDDEVYDDKAITKVLKNIFKNTEDVKGNTTSQANIDALNRVEKGIEKLGEIIQTLLPIKQEPEPTEPTTPIIDVEMPEFDYVRKRGGRIVKRPKKMQQKKQEAK